jgi:hypothetical protein
VKDADTTGCPASFEIGEFESWKRMMYIFKHSEEGLCLEESTPDFEVIKHLHHVRGIGDEDYECTERSERLYIDMQDPTSQRVRRAAQHADGRVANYIAVAIVNLNTRAAHTVRP